MQLKRQYDEADLQRYQADRERLTAEWETKLRETGMDESLVATAAKQQVDKVIQPPMISGVEVIDTGASVDQHFSTSLVTEFLKLGIMEIDRDQLTLHAGNEDMHYTIMREPGRWCLHCGEKLPDDTGGELARLHIARKHKGVPSPVQDNPAGYELLTYFDCMLDAEQHDRFKKGANNG